MKIIIILLLALAAATLRYILPFLTPVPVSPIEIL